MSEEIEEKIIQVITKTQNLSAGQVTLDTTFDEIGMTSLDALALIFDLEEEFGISIPNEEAMGLRNVKQATEVVRRLLLVNPSPQKDAGGEV